MPRQRGRSLRDARASNYGSGARGAGLAPAAPASGHSRRRCGSERPPVGELRARDAGLGGVAALDHAVVSVAPFLHSFNAVSLSTSVLLLGGWCRQKGHEKVD